jgi:hypothetical protein
MATNDESDSLERLAYRLSLSALRHQETSLTELGWSLDLAGILK